jgi:hypothetical protein
MMCATMVGSGFILQGRIVAQAARLVMSSAPSSGAYALGRMSAAIRLFRAKWQPDHFSIGIAILTMETADVLSQV